MARKARTTTEEAPAEGHTLQEAMAPEPPVNGHIANPSSKPRPHSFAQAAKKLPGRLGIKAGDLTVEMVDFGNAGGVGIRVVLPEGRQLTDDEKNLIREHVKGENGRPGLTWDRHAGMWHAQIGADSPPARSVAIRLNAEGRVEKLAEALKQHQADPVGYADMVKHQREQAAEAGRIPD